MEKKKQITMEDILKLKIGEGMVIPESTFRNVSSKEKLREKARTSRC